jgi:hypothetical protein
MKKKNMFMQEAFGKHPGALHKQLSVPLETNMGEMKTLLEKIKVTKIGSTIKNPLVTGKAEYKVTLLMKRRANLALIGIRNSQNR